MFDLENHIHFVLRLVNRSEQNDFFFYNTLYCQRKKEKMGKIKGKFEEFLGSFGVAFTDVQN
jgi:hypothetical protein